jgi:hypothetical protein
VLSILSPLELESLIDKVMEANKTNYNNTEKRKETQKRIDILEETLLEKKKASSKK